MAKTYVTCKGNGRTEKTATGGNAGVTASVQSWDGSIIVQNWYGSDGKLMVSVGTADRSTAYIGDTNVRFTGTFEEFTEALRSICKLG